MTELAASFKWRSTAGASRFRKSRAQTETGTHGGGTLPRPLRPAIKPASSPSQLHKAQRRGSRLSFPPFRPAPAKRLTRSVPNAGMTRIRFKGSISVPYALAPWRVLLSSSGCFRSRLQKPRSKADHERLRVARAVVHWRQAGRPSEQSGCWPKYRRSASEIVEKNAEARASLRQGGGIVRMRRNRDRLGDRRAHRAF